jgi:hypothetical protein
LVLLLLIDSYEEADDVCKSFDRESSVEEFPDLSDLADKIDETAVVGKRRPKHKVIVDESDSDRSPIIKKRE